MPRLQSRGLQLWFWWQDPSSSLFSPGPHKAELMGASMNTAWLCGHNDLRVLADLRTTDYTPEQFRIMADFLEEAMEAGFIGFSTGLDFDPGVLSRPEEVERLAAIAAKYDAIYCTHMRDESYHLFEAVE